MEITGFCNIWPSIIAVDIPKTINMLHELINGIMPITKLDLFKKNIQDITLNNMYNKWKKWEKTIIYQQDESDYEDFDDLLDYGED